MKILYFGGGLGNQIFEYAFYLSIKDKFPEEKIFGIYSKKRFKEHAGGFEIERIFNVRLPKSSWKALAMMKILMAWNKFISSTNWYCHNLTNPNYKATLFNAFKMNFDFYKERHEWIKFKDINLSVQNKGIISHMNSTESVVIHVRRGDFLSYKYVANHANIATEKYYKNAIKYIEKKFKKPQFFVFSDDILWCKDNFKLDNVTYIDWNNGKNSYIDMFLMKHGKANIIANSTFSYWGAYFNENNPLVIYPKKWIHSEGILNIFPNKWIAIDS